METNGYWWQVAHNATRPLFKVSDFVQDDLPSFVSSINNEVDEEGKSKKACELSAKIEELFNEITVKDIENIVNSKVFRLSILDIKMCAMSLWHSGHKNLPVSLANMLELVCRVTGDPHILTYEDIILENPAGDIRTFFTKDGVGLDEELFYRSHFLIEEKILEIASILKNSIALQFVSDEKISFIEERMNEANSLVIRMMSELNNSHFTVFRKYLGATANLKGPSGAFSGTYPLIDLYWRGTTNIFNGNRDRYKMDNMYFPSFQRKEISQLVENPSVSIRSLAKAKISGFVDLYMVLHKTMYKFRQTHLASVKKHIPNVLNNKAPGTMGDDNTGTYLRDSLSDTKKANL